MTIDQLWEWNLKSGYRLPIAQITYDAVKELTAIDLYNRLKNKSINYVIPCCYYCSRVMCHVGELRIYFDLGNDLCTLRGCYGGERMTELEFYNVVGSNADNTNKINIKVCLDRQTVIPNTRCTLKQLCSKLSRIIHKRL